MSKSKVKEILLLLGFRTLLNILGNQRRFRHSTWKGGQILLRGSNFGLRFFYVLVNIRSGTHSFTSLPKEVILRIFTLWKIHRPRPGSKPRTSDHNSFPNPSVPLPTSQLILQPLHRFTYVIAHSPILPTLYLRHSSFYSPSVASPTSPGEPPMPLWCLIYP